MKKTNIKYGSIAICKNGDIGIITSKQPTKTGIWKGLNLSNTCKKEWESKDPQVIGYIYKKDMDQVIKIYYQDFL